MFFSATGRTTTTTKAAVVNRRKRAAAEEGGTAKTTAVEANATADVVPQPPPFVLVVRPEPSAAAADTVHGLFTRHPWCALAGRQTLVRLFVVFFRFFYYSFDCDVADSR